MVSQDLLVRTALAELLAARGIPADSGVSLRWVRVRMFGVPIVFPNFAARRAILFMHDVHHLLTGYETTWRGEAEIGAYEIATGCKRYWAAWFFNIGGFLFGLVIAPRRMFRAFVRARDCTNFYGVPAERVGAMTLAAARAELGLNQPLRAATRRDWPAFLLWTLLFVAAYVLVPITALVLLWHWLCG